jgi:predicted phage-related endonuclease
MWWEESPAPPITILPDPLPEFDPAPGPLFCTPDRLLLDSDGKPFAVLEIKCAWYDQARRFRSELPLDYRAQVQVQLHCTGLDVAYYAVLLWGMELRWYKEERHQRFIDAIRRKAEEFWKLVEDRTPPPTDWLPATSKAIGRHYQEVEPVRVDLPPEADDWARERESLAARIKEAEKKKQAIDNQLKAAIGSAEIGVLPDGEAAYSWKKTARGRSLRRTSVREIGDE